VAPAAARKFPGVQFLVVGGPVADEHIELARQYPFIRFEGFQKELSLYYQKADVVVGAGRVALEAMALKKPVIAIGERLYVGPLSPKNLELAKGSNFGDCAEKESFDGSRAAKDLLELLSHKTKRVQVAKTGQVLLQSDYLMDQVFTQTETLYRRVMLERNLRRFHELPVLMYHRVTDQAPVASKYNIYVTKATLEKHLQFLKVRGFQTITFEDLCSHRVPENPVILTFDDGYLDNYENLFPLLQKYGMKAVIYILGDRKHRNNYWDIPKGEIEAPLMNDAQVKEMARSGHVEFGSHAMDHVRLTDLAPAQAQKQIAQSRKVLGDLVGKPILSLAYPYGVYNDEVKRLTAEAGYNFGISVGGPYTRFGDDLFEIRRVHMFPRSTVFDLWKKTTGFYHRYRKLTGKFNVS
jgi:peptidoglycan/xylan/chitin deacetylase (PgdA/CDA1 family)